MAITFQVSRVERATNPLSAPEAAELTLQGVTVEAMGASAAAFLPSKQHALVQAAHWAYSNHYPLILSPDVIWLAIRRSKVAALASLR
jgi:hypothetical protein